MREESVARIKRRKEGRLIRLKRNTARLDRQTCTDDKGKEYEEWPPEQEPPQGWERDKWESI
jgi:hypothetical protein